MSRQRQSSWTSRILAHLWLAIPAGVIGAVAVLALLNRPGTTPDAATSPAATVSPAPDRTMGENGEAQGLVEEFIVTDPGEVLPDRPADADLPGQSFPDLGRDHVPDAIEALYMVHIARGPECSRGQCPG